MADRSSEASFEQVYQALSRRAVSMMEAISGPQPPPSASPFLCPAKLDRDAIFIKKATAVASAVLSHLVHNPAFSSCHQRSLSGGTVYLRREDEDGLLASIDAIVSRVVIRPSVFRSGDLNDDRFTVVCFVAERKPPEGQDESQLWTVEDELMKGVCGGSNIHLYVVMPLADGINYANVVFARALKDGEQPLDLMRETNAHGTAVNWVSPRAYTDVSIHSGEFLGNLRRGVGHVHIKRTNLLHFGSSIAGQPWRTVIPRDEWFDAFDASGLLGSAYEFAAAAQPFSSPDENGAHPFARTSSSSPLLSFVLPNSVPVRWCSCQSHNSAKLYADTFQWLGRATGIVFAAVPAEPVWTAGTWQALTHPTRSEVDVVVFCGAQFGIAAYGRAVAEAGHDAWLHESLRATVLAAPAYKSLPTAKSPGAAPSTSENRKPLYHSVLVTSPSFAAKSLTNTSRGLRALQNSRFAYNELTSWTGYLSVDCAVKAVAPASTPATYFSALVHTGSHKASLEAVCSESADVACIDAVVLHHALLQDSTISDRIQLVEEPLLSAEVPWPMPPIVASRRLPPQLRWAISAALLRMNEDTQGAEILAAHEVSRYAPVTSAPYRVFPEVAAGAHS